MIYQYKKAINPLLLRNIKRKLTNMSIDNSKSKIVSKSQDEDFSAPIWRNSILCVFCLLVVYKIDEWYGLHHEGKGGFTRVIEYFIKDEEKYRELNIENLKKISEIAKERLHQQDSKRKSIYRLKFPEQLNQGSSYNLKVGTEIDLSQYNIKSDVDSIN
ncbi:hypothetical protein PNEG_00112 [Pneumocystis murina B123]|uniref:Uncharacterized protein n=1 Tax=Pneumocystis murina (strain B123) TaxID=1069680 RepID=M7PMH4_PNEMU|nr:hypothetical protein PNEG_00112 [Pneumocystis murina B123]EMR11674.1 hypothetical protein PNEG_00112 [Pneumocystis murina B123]